MGGGRRGPRSTVSVVRVQGDVAGGGGPVDGAGGVVGRPEVSQRGRRASGRAARTPVDASEVEATTRGRAVVELAARPRAATTASASARSGRSPVVGPVLDLDVDDASAGAGVEGRGEQSGRRPGGRPTPSPTTRRPSGRSASWWTASAPSAVRRTSSSTPSAPRSRRRRNASTRVLAEARRTPRGGRSRAVANVTFDAPKNCLQELARAGYRVQTQPHTLSPILQRGGM